MHAFVDETKGNGLIMVSVLAAPDTLPRTRGELCRLRAKGQHRIHFSKEGPPRRRLISSALVKMDLHANVYDARGIRDPVLARQRALEELITDLAGAHSRRLVIEQDESLVASDRAVLYEAVRKHDLHWDFTYVHMKPHQEPLLWAADALAWCLGRGATWAEQVSPLINSTRNVR
ncbi:hypothetical protein [Nocardia transvalensis]|uniref:hypothetical protein n=1 Tax=Nocardia transvalensis TaxID=37333 RepID=UPI001894DA08|nr:hypothetical protein [Nocardia transvalensis]MBF6329223.1 hypothetical protein [Nocardia transvalensis]